jgi:MFS family permease
MSYAVACGIPALTVITVYKVDGNAGDRFGAKWVLVAGLLVQPIGALGHFFANNLASFCSVAALFCFIYAGLMPLRSVLLRDSFPLRIMGTLMGGLGFAAGPGMATGLVLGGWIFDITGKYGWLYLSSFGKGIGAYLIAILFRPFPKLIQATPGLAAAGHSHIDGRTWWFHPALPMFGVS